MNIDKFVTDLTKNPRKAIVYAVLLVICIVVLYWLWTKLKSGVSSIVERIETNRENPVETSKLTYEDSWYKTSANSIFNAMNRVGTDETTIYNILIKLRNQDDYNQLNREYGKREITKGIDSPMGTMLEHFREELDDTFIGNMQIFLRNNYGIEMK
jgi:hypothetical protein